MIHSGKAQINWDSGSHLQSSLPETQSMVVRSGTGSDRSLGKTGKNSSFAKLAQALMIPLHDCWDSNSI